MPKTREQKKQMIQELADKFGKMKSAVFTSISGYTVEDATALRSTGHKKGVELMVTKKTLLLQALVLIFQKRFLMSLLLREEFGKR